MLPHALLFLVSLSAHTSVYVKGHSRAAVKTREQLQGLTCYEPASTPQESAGTLEVDHLYSRAGDPSVVMIFTDYRGTVLWEGKTLEDPVPLRSSVNRLLKQLAKATCQLPAVPIIKIKTAVGANSPNPPSRQR